MSPEEVKALMCELCGEIGQFAVVTDDRPRIICKRNGEICCMTYGYANREEALAAWARHHEDDTY